MPSLELESVVRELVTKLAGSDFDHVVADCSVSRLSAVDLRNVIADYGRTIIAPPDDAYQDLDAVAVRDAVVPTWSVRVPLWSEEEGRSDLELQLTIQQQDGHWAIELDDLLVP